MSDDEYDNVPDLFSNIDWDTIPELSSPPQVATSSSQDSVIPPLAEGIGSPSSSQYSCDDEFNVSFLEELNALEERLTQDGVQVHQPPAEVSSNSTNAQQRSDITPTSPKSPTHAEDRTQPSTLSDLSPAKPPTHIDQNETPQTAKRKRSSSPAAPVDSPRKRSKMKDVGCDSVVESQVAERMSTYLSTFQDEMTCPICCDNFAAAYMGNPCGHTFCGECGWAWIEKCNKDPSCPVCRTVLASGAPILPNITVDNAVLKHIEALQINGCEEWKPGGSRFKDWLAKKERWKTVGAIKMIAKAAPKRNTVDSVIRDTLHKGYSVIRDRIFGPPIWLPLKLGEKGYSLRYGIKHSLNP